MRVGDIEDRDARPTQEQHRDPIAAVRFSHIMKSFGQLEVLRDLNFEVPSSQKVAIIGPSGSGKTTLLRLLMTLEQPDSGIIEVAGELLGLKRVGDRLVRDDEAHLRKVRTNIGMVFQQFNLFPHMTALKNVMVGPVNVLRLAPDEAKEHAARLLAMVGLSDKETAYPRQLSGGQQQRVAIARALAMRPRIMLFDEVTSALDPELVGEVLDVIRRLAQENAFTMLIVTHEMSFAHDIADRVIFMDGGTIVEDAPPNVIFSNPSNERTRAFLRAILASGRWRTET